MIFLKMDIDIRIITAFVDEKNEKWVGNLCSRSSLDFHAVAIEIDNEKL